MTPDELEALVLEAGDASLLRQAFASLDERQRAKLSTAAQKLFQQIYRNKAGAGASDRLERFIARRPGDFWQHWNSESNSDKPPSIGSLL